MIESYLETIKKLEPAFIEAGKIAVKMQREISPKKKKSTGIDEVDVVTEADFAVQEAVLSAISKTELIQCRLIAEEKTDLVDKFDPEGEFLLTVDPIDGTYRYAAREPIYSLIISIQKDGLPLYTFDHYPAMDWTHKFIGKEHQESGKRPTLNLSANGNKIITYPYGDPIKKIPEAMWQEIEKRGYKFINGKELSLGFGAKVTLLSDQVDGYYCENPPAEDGLVGLHYAMTHDWEINNQLESKEPQKGLHGMVYPGFYFIIRR
ncbi:MAG: hypothetical protein UY26_C0003G0020 [Candidatus Jorgensenbacteria bacterium GW2011_GWA1_48_13]|uniref:Inositol monophosphatase n=2 Tax=Candidatus Joergenseniibacteriota TaxID=1752739 RepID=A0A0G1W885_9BACT|nr:MAG: hypothetical protein UY26_C0003G0020 [Candidatus Jorgensenbacteria bacterium GW2011_GWA1_48_13]KKU99301.1 MAG: hypothetical protein UY32_C0002G0037 [Candidatus Jorgensenbacteria bacterium GW2011_GWC1_48_8]KKW14981.1 MAG: hypothetical protein UY55_C0002G0037 [Candidatus Jorgensenbacteria bacterium GW2011_GWB1_50_10]